MGSSNESSKYTPSSIPKPNPNIKEEEEKEKMALTLEFNKLKYSPDLPIQNCEYVDGNIKHWRIIFQGSIYSPYEDGIFTLEFIFNKGRFPNNGPEAKFMTKMFHPNIDSNGHVCINLLNDWKSGTSLETVFYGILDIMDHPVASGGYSNEARKLLEKSEEEFYKKVEEYTITYAKILQ